MRFRKLRIAFSATCLIACALVIALWVRSYWRIEGGHATFMGRVYYTSSVHGRVVVSEEPRQQADTMQQFMQGGSTPDWEVISQPFETTNLDDTNVNFGLPGFPGFDLYSLADGTVRAVFPHWFVILFVAAFAATTRMPWRFSLRTLLIATTLIAVVLGLIAYAARK